MVFLKGVILTVLATTVVRRPTGVTSKLTPVFLPLILTLSLHVILT